MARYQYQPLVGPIWVASVAASLSWLPAGNPQPVRTLPRASAPPRTVGVAQVYDPAGLGWIPTGRPQVLGLPRSLPSSSIAAPFQPSYDPSDLAWQVRGVLPARAAPLLGQDRTVLPPFQPAAGFDPQFFPWPPQAGPQPLECRRITGSVLDPLPIPPPPFDPADLAWQSRGQQPVRILPRAYPNSWSVVVVPLYDPAALSWIPTIARPSASLPRTLPSGTLAPPFQPPAAPFDPATLGWIPQGVNQPQRALPRGQWDYTEIVAALYDPAGLDWYLGSARPNVAPPRSVSTWSLLSPLPIPPVAFDPVQFPWPYTVWPRPPERRILGETAQPFTAALYKPEFLQWLPPEARPARTLGRAGQTWDVLSPLPIAPPPFDPAHLAWMPSDRPLPRTVLASLLGSTVLDPLPIPGVPVPPVIVPPAPQGGKSKGKKSFYAPVPRRRKLAIEPFLRLEPERAPGPTVPTVPAVPAVEPPAASRALAPIVLPQVPPRVPIPAYFETVGIEPSLRAAMETLARFVPRQIVPEFPPIIDLPGVSDDQDLEDLLVIRAALANLRGG